MIASIVDWLQTSVGLSAQALGRVAGSLAAIIGLWAIRRFVLMIVNRRIDDIRLRYRWRKTTSYIVVPIGMLVVGGIWFEGVGSLATYLGLLSAGIAIALRDPLVNLAGWAFILWRRPFEVGDRIEIGNHRGDVIDLRIFQFTLMEIGNWVDADQSTGRIIHLPNGMVFSQGLANYSKGFQFIWNELPILLTFESNWRAAREILREIADRHAADVTHDAQAKVREVAERFMIFYQNLTPIVYTNVKDSGVELTIRYLCEPRQRRGTAQGIWHDVLDAFAARDDIDFAYPTQRFYDNRTEGKPGARAQS